MLKKCLVCLTCLLILTFVWITSSTATFSNYSKESEVYLGKNNSCAQITKIQNGKMPSQFYKYGEGCQIDKKDFDLGTLLSDLEAKVLWTETTDYGVSYYAYSKKLKYSCELRGRKVNLQVFIGKESVKLASPIIYGSY